MSPAVQPPDRVLYQFPISHYCEKSRWNLDVKGLPYAVRNLLPGVHVVVTRRLASATTLPLLVDRGVAISDSSAIALHLERAYPTPELLPADPAARARTLALEGFFDDHAGGDVRRWMYGQLLPSGAATRIFFRGYAGAARAVGTVMAPLFGRVLRRRYRIRPETIERSRTRLLAALDRLEQETAHDPTRYLVGHALTLADITAAALLGPLVGPPGTPWADDGELPDVAAEMRAAVRRRPAGQWVLQRYAQDRERGARA